MRRNRQSNHDEDNGFGAWGGYMAAKVAKLQDQFKETASNEVVKVSNILSGIAIFVNGLTNPTSDELRQLMALHGGIFHLYQHASTTHIIASNLPSVKINKLGSVPIVKASWITDSIELNTLLDYKPYLLYTNQSTSQPKLDFPVVPKTKTASDPNFLEEFYSNSRLHLIATLGAEYKQLVSEWRDKSRDFPAREKLLQLPQNQVSQGTILMHIDMDCFFVSVGLRTRPELRGLPVAVTHARNPQISSKEREASVTMNLDRLPQPNEMKMVDGKSSMSEVASCSYEARRCGVRNGMFLGAAAKLCPDIKTIPYDFEGYKEVSMTLYKTIATYTLDIEAVSCDEMYVDVSELLRIFNLRVEDWANHIRGEIMSMTGCPCSTGFGANRLQARMATKKAKPGGFFHLRPEDVETYMSEIPLADIPGVGRATLHKLRSLGLDSCGDLQVASFQVLQRELGSKAGETLMEQCKGIDNRPLNYNHERKSVSAEINYGIRFKALEECHKFLECLANEVCNRLNEVKMRARCVTLKLMVRASDAPVETAKFLGHGLCDSLSKSSTTTYAVADSNAICKEARNLYDKMHIQFIELRGMGIQLSKLEKMAPVNPTLSRFLQQPGKPVETSPKPVGKEKPARGRVKKTKTTINRFFKSARDTSTNLKKFQISKEQVDLNVLQELPQHIRDEIMKEYNIDTKIPKPESRVKAPEQVVLPPVQKNPFTDMQWHQLKPVLYDWMKTEKPQIVDVEMLGEHFRQLAGDRKIERLQLIFNFLHRTFGDLDCSWHHAYHVLVDFAQQGMVARYDQ